MKWKILLEGNETNCCVDGATHELAMQAARAHLSLAKPSRVTVEPTAEEGKCHDDRHYSKSGPILSHDEL